MRRSPLVLCAMALAAISVPQAVRAENAEATAQIERGILAVEAHDLAGAVEAFREAGQLEPGRAEAWCLFAEALRLSGEESSDAFDACLRTARQSHDAPWTARALHGRAASLELEPERLPDARTAWEEYVRFAEGAPDVASTAVGRARIEAIDRVIQLERATVLVRARILERAAPPRSGRR